MFEKLITLILVNLGLMFAIYALYWGRVMVKRDLANYRKRWAEAAARRALEREAEAERQKELEAERKREAGRRKELEAEAEAEREREAKAEAKREAKREAEREAEREREAKAEEKREAKREREAKAEAKREAEAEAERQKKLEAERQKEAGTEVEEKVEEELEAEVEIFEKDDGTYYYNDPESGNEITCDEEGNEIDEEIIKKNLMEGIASLDEEMARIEELKSKLDSEDITPEEIEEFKKLLKEDD